MRILAETEYNPELNKHYEGAFCQGAGLLHVRASFEEGLADAPQDESYMRLPANVTLETPRHPLSKQGVYIPGVCGKHPLLGEVIVNLPYFLGLAVCADGQALDMSNVRGYSRALELETGVLTRRFTWDRPSGASLKAEYRRWVSRTLPGVTVQAISYNCLEGNASLTFESFTDAAVRTNGYDHFSEVSPLADGDTVSVGIVTDLGHHAHILSRTLGLPFTPTHTNKRRPSVTASVSLAAGESVRLVKVSAAGRAAGETQELLDNALAELDELERKDKAAWATLWEHCRVVVEGDDALQEALDFSLYHLLRVSHPDDSSVAVCAKGFAGEAYFGHYFWDSEIYLAPFYQHTFPQMARCLSEYRLRTLDGARRNAKRVFLPGAKYAWESGMTGDEQCPNWQYADLEIHVSADVSYGIWQVWRHTGDKAFLTRALQALLDIARYWEARTYREKDGIPHINGVMGPDEYICFCNDNAYTNTMASKALQIACDALEILGESDDGAEHWRELALSLPDMRQSDGLTLQCARFEEFEDVDFERIWTDRSKPFGHMVSQDYNYRTKALKQADALMLSYLFPEEYTQDELMRNFRYYLPLTTHDSSLSYAVHAALAFRLGDSALGYDLLHNAMGIDIDGGAAEGVHIANCGGLWQAVVFGMAGLSRSPDTAPVLSPCLPKHIRSLRFPFVRNGTVLHATIKEDNTWTICI